MPEKKTTGMKTIQNRVLDNRIPRTDHGKNQFGRITLRVKDEKERQSKVRFGERKRV